MDRNIPPSTPMPLIWECGCIVVAMEDIEQGDAIEVSDVCPEHGSPLVLKGTWREIAY